MINILLQIIKNEINKIFDKIIFLKLINYKNIILG